MCIVLIECLVLNVIVEVAGLKTSLKAYEQRHNWRRAFLKTHPLIFVNSVIRSRAIVCVFLILNLFLLSLI